MPTSSKSYNSTDEDRLISFESDEKEYPLVKFRKTNQGSTINLKPIVQVETALKKVRFFVRAMPHKMESLHLVAIQSRFYALEGV